MTITQDVVDATHDRHRQEEHVDVAGQAFTACRCGRMFDDADEATTHWWRSARARQRAANREA